MKVVIDRDIPFLAGVLEPYAQVVYVRGTEIDFNSIRDADALLVRTRTKCNRDLLESSQGLSSVSFLASATMGTDHIDLEYLRSRGVVFEYAPGCNAGGVMQYVFTSVYAVAQYGRSPFSLKGKTLGVIGVGNTGSRVADFGEYLGFDVLRNDPPRALREGGDDFCSLDYLLENSDIISMHVPLNEDTLAMVSGDFFARAKSGLVFVNSSRGEVVVDKALLEADLQALILDVWNREPSFISQAVLDRADIATPHIAGYSLEGKMNGTAMIVQAFARHFKIAELETFMPFCSPTPVLEVVPSSMSQKEISDKLLSIFPVFELDKMLRFAPDEFERIRSEYVYRREFARRP